MVTLWLPRFSAMPWNSPREPSVKRGMLAKKSTWRIRTRVCWIWKNLEVPLTRWETSKGNNQGNNHPTEAIPRSEFLGRIAAMACTQAWRFASSRMLRWTAETSVFGQRTYLYRVYTYLTLSNSLRTGKSPFFMGKSTSSTQWPWLQYHGRFHRGSSGRTHHREKLFLPGRVVLETWNPFQNPSFLSLYIFLLDNIINTYCIGIHTYIYMYICIYIYTYIHRYIHTYIWYFPPIQEPGLQQLGFLSYLLGFPVTSCQVRAISAYGPGQWSFAYGTQMYPAGDG